MIEKNQAEGIYKKYKESDRIRQYDFYEKLYDGDHFSAFNMASDNMKEEYARLRYVVNNFCGLTSKVIADMLFGESIQIVDEKNQDWIDALTFETNFNALLYENALANSYFGDNLLKIRVEDGVLKIEDTSPTMYWPELDNNNARSKPKREHLINVFKQGSDRYVIFETHEPPKISTQGFKQNKDDGELIPISIDQTNKLLGQKVEEEVDTGIDRSLITHIPNPKPRGYFGDSDYKDLKNLQFALNNRMTMTDNVLDKHTDPILAVPEGVIDEEGNVRKEAFKMFEMDESGTTPEYIVWNANLEYAFKQIDKLVDFMFMFSETSPDVLGVGEGRGQAESGRALKMRLLRTIAKRNRKKIYYDNAIKRTIYTAELLAKKNNFKISKDDTIKLGEPTIPEIRWEDGIVNDEVERTELTSLKVETGLISKKRAIKDLEGISDDEAEKIIKEVDEEKADFTSFLDKPEQDES